jgi:hypothetical protein
LAVENSLAAKEAVAVFHSRLSPLKNRKTRRIFDWLREKTLEVAAINPVLLTKNAFLPL